MITFDPPIVAGTTLVRDAIQSQNYVTGVSGWGIFQNGLAEFNDIIIRGGTVEGGTGLYYNGTPANGNLVASITAASGTDDFGNPYLAGISVYDPGTSTFANMDGGVLNIGNLEAGNTPDVTQSTQMTSEPGAFNLTGPRNTDAGFSDRIFMQVLAGETLVTQPNTSEPRVHFQDTADNSIVSMELSGVLLKTDIGGTSESWQVPTLIANWTNDSLAYRLDANDNVVWTGKFHYTGTAVTGASAASLLTAAVPSKFRPAQTSPIPLVHRTSTNVEKNTSASLDIRSDGTISVFWSDGVAGTSHDVNGLANGDAFYIAQSVPLRNQA